MKTPIPSYPFKQLQNIDQKIGLTTIKETLSLRDEVSFTTPHSLDFFVFMLITEGEYEHVLDEKTYQLQAGDLFIICPNQIHNFTKLDGFDGYIVTFSECFLKDFLIFFNPMVKYELLYEFYLIKQIKLSTYTVNQFISVYLLLLEETQKESDLCQKLILLNLFSVILHNIERELKSNILVRKIMIDNVFMNFKKVLCEDINYKYNVQYYADKMKISIRTLQTVSKRNMNKTPKEIIDDNLIIECKRQLLMSNFLIQEVAFALGFDDPSAFSKYFKKNTGLSPIEFKESYVSK